MNAKKGLYKWKRQTNPLEAARGNKQDTLDQWMKKVQNASEIAAKEAFGGDIFGKTDFDILPDDEAMYEAQTLLDGWLQEKASPDLTNEVDFRSENWNKTTPIMLDSELHFENGSLSPTASARNWLGEMLLEPSDATGAIQKEYERDYMKLQDYDDDDDISNQLLVNEVLHGMLTKDIASGIDLGMKPLMKTVKDPVPKMNLRHQQVKTKIRARRKRDLQNKKESQTKEEIQKKAKERILQEERNKLESQQHEEKAIQEEMLKIRQNLKEEKKKREDELERKAKIFEEAKAEIQRELRKQKEDEKERRIQQRKIEELNYTRREKQINEQTIIEMRSNMQTLHKHFAAWYNVVLERRVLAGKARAVNDWKRKLKAWNAWKAYISHLKSDQEAMAIEEKMKEDYRKGQMALTHHHRKILKLCFFSWSRYTRHKIDKKLLKLEHESKAKKMAMFLEAASKGLARNKHNGEVDGGDEFITADAKDKKHEQKNCKQRVIREATKGNYRITKNTETSSISSENILQPKEHVLKNTEMCNTHAIHKRSNSLLNNIKVNKNSEKSSNVINSKHERNIQRSSGYSLTNGANERGIRDNREDKNTKDRLATVYDFVDQGNHRSTETVSQLSERNETTTQPPTPRSRSEKLNTKPLHLAMEERAMQRRDRREQIEAEKRRKEEERLKELKEQQEERLRNEESEKRERIKRRKEEKKMEAEKEQQKLERIAAMRTKADLSRNHNEKRLVEKFGLEPLKRLVQIARLNERISEKYCNTLLLKKTIKDWSEQTKEIVREKQNRADEKFRDILLKRSFRSWKKCRFHLQMLNKLARSHSIVRIKKRAFRAWQDYVTDERILMWAKENDAEEFDVVRMRKKYFHTWIQFIKFEKEERIREKRREQLRKKVQTWLPDFQST